MSNRSVGVRAIGGRDPQHIIPTIVRHKIYETTYWKDRCFGLNAATLIDQAQTIKEVGTTYGDFDIPTQFICLILKLLQIQPELEIIIQYIEQDASKYLRVLTALYVRLTERSPVIYSILESLYSDYRRVRVRDKSGVYHISHVDEIVDQLLNDTSFYGLPLPRMVKREILVKNGVLEPRVSPLEGDIDQLMQTSSDDPSHSATDQHVESSDSLSSSVEQNQTLADTSMTNHDDKRLMPVPESPSLNVSSSSHSPAAENSSKNLRAEHSHESSHSRNHRSSHPRSHCEHDSEYYSYKRSSRRHRSPSPDRRSSRRYRSSSRSRERSRSRSRSRSPKRSRHTRR